MRVNSAKLAEFVNRAVIADCPFGSDCSLCDIDSLCWLLEENIRENFGMKILI